MLPKELVCDRCWSTVFNTEDFENLCTLDRSQIDYGSTLIQATATVGEIKNSVCNWCSYMCEFISDDWTTEDKVTILLSPTRIASTLPPGGNIFYLSSACTSSTTGKDKGGYSLFIHACTGADDPAAAYVTARPLRTDVDSYDAWKQMRTWLTECKEHELCSISQQEVVLPPRVIEVSPSEHQRPRIVESSGMHGVYASVSYCWGKRPFLALSKANHGQLTEGLDMESLPPTIQDAITITRALSIPYLWVDALCIIQDNEEQKVKEIANMKELYSSSALTIIASAAENVYQGLLYPRVQQETLHTIPVRLGPGRFGTMSINELDGACYDERLESIAKRAWTLQEQLLSNRTLAFTTQTMTWRCRERVQNFGNSLYFPHDLDSGYNENDEKYSLNLHSLLPEGEEADSAKDKCLSCWLRLVTVYSLRATSLERDKLNAVAGVASHPSFSEVLGPGYFAGLWQHNLARQLTWYTSDRHRTLEEDETFTFRRPITYRAPSWSWASLDGGIIHFDFNFDDEDETPPDIICEIIDCSTAAAFPKLNPFGEILSAKLILKSPIKRAWFNPATSNVLLLPGLITSIKTTLIPDESVMTFEQAFERHSKEYFDANGEIDRDVIKEDPEGTYLHGTWIRNMCGMYDETVLPEPCLVLCAAITMRKDAYDGYGVRGLLLVDEKQGSDNHHLKRIGSFERGRNRDFENEFRSELCII
ncbi:uncharacterized protein N7511_005213 [Penicillium nucicola]|uniref:uncharacterized protein n=1 Tax=Penicillium nucicola TaxID=1850975 RepID=UPI00254552EA|nr:uncharacterized protein N7511_005213 [Penicillium nucicola]KAJ5761831.1 hypothetical protein N7511_005213 [Penicillium nucicola]